MSEPSDPHGSAGEARAHSTAAGDVSTLDGIVGNLYRAVCFDPGGLPNYDALRSLFTHNGTLTPPRPDEHRGVEVLSLEGFIARSRKLIEESDHGDRGFFEQEIGHRAESFGDIAHVFSTYESRYSEDSPEVIGRGINSIQLVRNDDRWWIVSILWDVERPNETIPNKYLRHPRAQRSD